MYRIVSYRERSADGLQTRSRNSGGSRRLKKARWIVGFGAEFDSQSCLRFWTGTSNGWWSSTVKLRAKVRVAPSLIQRGWRPSSPPSLNPPLSRKMTTVPALTSVWAVVIGQPHIPAQLFDETGEHELICSVLAHQESWAKMFCRNSIYSQWQISLLKQHF